MAFVAGSNIGSDQEIKGWKFAVTSGLLGWVLDAFDFFVVVFLFDTLAARFHVSEGVGRLHADVDPGDAAGGSAIFRRTGRQIWPQAPIDVLRTVLLPVHGIDRAGADLLGVRSLSRAIWHWHGRLLGHRRFLRDGEFAASLSRSALRHDAGGISDGLSAGFGRDADHCSRLWVEGGVLCGRSGRTACHWADAIRAGVRSMEAASASVDETIFTALLHHKGMFLYLLLMMSVLLVPVAWHAGSVSRLPQVGPRHRGEDGARDEGAYTAFQLSTTLARSWARSFSGIYRKGGAAEGDHAGAGGFAAVDSGLGVRRLRSECW